MAEVESEGKWLEVAGGGSGGIKDGAKSILYSAYKMLICEPLKKKKLRSINICSYFIYDFILPHGSKLAHYLVWNGGTNKMGKIVAQYY